MDVAQVKEFDNGDIQASWSTHHYPWRNVPATAVTFSPGDQHFVWWTGTCNGIFKMKFNTLLLPLETPPSHPVPANATSWPGRMPRVIISCITAFFVNTGNETSGTIIPRVNTHQHIYASSNQLYFSDSVVVLSFPSLLPPPLIKDTHGYPKAAKSFYQNYSALVRDHKRLKHTTLSATTLLWLIVF